MFEGSMTATATGYVSAGQLARHFGVNPVTVYAWSDKGLPYIGGNGIRRRYRVDWTEDWLKRLREEEG